ncbi:hypothetical protein GCM10009127_19620 [Alteraurantiacibacter aestuarii]
MIETVIRKRIEILVDKPLVGRITREITAAGIKGWTVMPVISGSGRDGPWHEDRITSSDKAMIITISSVENALKLAEALQPILTSHGMLLDMWDVEVIRAERF